MVLIDKITTAGVSSGTITLQHTVASSDCVMLILTSANSGSTTSVTVNGTSIPQIATAGSTSIAQMWYTKSPGVGSRTIVVKTSSSIQATAIVITLIGVSKVSTNILTNAITTSSPPLNTIQVPSANSFLIDLVGGSSSGAGTPGAGQTQIYQNTANESTSASFKYTGVGLQSMSWSGSPGGGHIVAVLQPAQAPSMWYPNIGYRSQKDDVTTLGWDTTGTTPVPSTTRSNATVFNTNSFLHTIGRILPSLLLPVRNTRTYNSFIKIEQIIQANPQTGTTFSHDVTVPSQDCIILVITSMGTGNTLSFIQYNGNNVQEAFFFTSGGKEFFHVITNPAVGTKTLTIAVTTAGVAYNIIVLSGVDKSNFKENYTDGAFLAKGTAITSTAPSLLLGNVLPGSIIFDNINGANDPGFPRTEQYRIFYDGTNDAGVSYRYGSGNVTLGWQNTQSSADYVAIAFAPSKTASISYPNVTIRNSLDIAQSNGLNTFNFAGTTPNNTRKFGPKPVQFWQNSFLHTAGRILSANVAMWSQKIMPMQDYPREYFDKIEVVDY